MKRIVITAAALALAACTTPTTTLKHPKTKQVATCGGNTSSSFAGGAIGYNMQKDADAECINTYKKQGFKVVQ